MDKEACMHYDDVLDDNTRQGMPHVKKTRVYVDRLF